MATDTPPTDAPPIDTTPTDATPIDTAPTDATLTDTTGNPTATDPTATDLQLWQGGPFFKLQQRLGVVRGNALDAPRQVLLVAAVAWLPVEVISLVQSLASGRWEPLLYRFDMHVRFLISVPLLFLAGLKVGDRVDESLRYLRESGILGDAQRPAYEVARRQVERLRDSPLAAALLLAIAVLAALPALRTARGLLAWWHLAVALPIFRFLLLRWAYRWCLWAWLLTRLSRLELGLVGTHPDRCGGLGPLDHPSRNFELTGLAVGSMLAASWGSRIAFDGVTFHQLLDLIAGYVLLVVFIAVAPLLVFVGPLQRLKRKTRRELSALALAYSLAFRAQWIEGRAPMPLGTPDPQSLADLGTSFEVMADARVVPISVRLLTELAVVALLPMLPLWASTVSAAEIIKTLGKSLL